MYVALIEEADLDQLALNDKIASIDIIVNHFNDDIPFSDTVSSLLNTIFGPRYFNGVSSGFEVLKNNPEVTLDDVLRFELTPYFEEATEDVERALEAINYYFHNKYNDLKCNHRPTSFSFLYPFVL